MDDDATDAARDPQEKNQIQVVARAAAILRAVEEESAGLSLAQIAHRVGLPRSTVQRIVNALAEERLLSAAAPSGRVVLGPAILRLASSAASDFADLARPHLVTLSADLKETVDLAVIKRDRAIFVDQIVGSQRLRAVSAVGESFPLYCSANGKAYLATLDNQSVEKLIGRAFEPRTPTTITTLEALLPELARVHRSGVAIAREEHTLGICAAGVALPDQFGNPHAISIPVPAARFAEVEREVTERLLRTKHALLELVAGPRAR